MPSLTRIWDCMFSPNLLRIYGSNLVEKLYEPSALERWGNHVISSIYIIWKLSVFTSPFIGIGIGILYHQEYLTSSSIVTFTKYVSGLGVLWVISHCCKGYGRATNPHYNAFIGALREAEKNMSPLSKLKISMYDFDFKAWPVEFSCQSRDPSQYVYTEKPIIDRNPIERVFNIPLKIIGTVAIHTFGIRLVYPGSLGILHMLLEKALSQGRSKLIEDYKGERFKLQTCDNNELDTMFVDRRSVQSNGNTLIICCEGNAGFYEIGIMCTPLEAGYSVLGWNHPGFFGSTGMPYPAQEQTAMDAIMQFAIVKLGFKVENIVIFAWSIGGYTAAWAAMNYPDIKGLVLDATFDDVLPLAVAHMPAWFEPIVKIAIKEHVNLNIAEQVEKYSGPLLLIRRTVDEVICLSENDLSSNRGNHLLIRILKKRYPFIMDDAQAQLVTYYLAVSPVNQAEIIQSYGVEEEVCYSLLQSYMSEHSRKYPLKLGEHFRLPEKNQMAIYLTRKYMKDFKSNHCANLPVEMFQLPWEVNNIKS